MGEPVEPKNPLSKTGPEPLPSEKPQLRMEHINSIAELSQIYLKAEAAEFSEDDLVANIPRLWQLSMDSKMQAKHAKQLQSIVSFVAGPPHDSRIAGLKGKISGLGSRNKSLEKEVASLKSSLAALQQISSGYSSRNESLHKELLVLKGNASVASGRLQETLNDNARLNTRLGKLESELQDYEKAIRSASELLTRAKKK